MTDVRPFPQRLHAERAILGCLMLDGALMGKVLGKLGPSDFHRPEHGLLLSMMAARSKAGKEIDLVALPEAILETGRSNDFGGIAYIIGLPDQVPSVHALDAYLGEVKDAAMRRKMISSARRLIDQAFGGQAVDGIVSEITDAMSRIDDDDARDESVGAVLNDALDALEKEHDGLQKPAISSGFADLDRQLGGGFRGGELTILAARPAMGKTALALNLAFGMTKSEPAGFFSLEMGRGQLGRRLFPMLAGVPMDRTVDGRKLRDEDWEPLLDARDNHATTPLVVDPRPGLRLHQIEAKARSWAAQGCKVIVLDYLGKIKADGDKRVSTGFNVSGLKDIARKLDMAVVCLAQLNRSVESRDNKRPMLSDLRDSGEIEQEADSVLFVYRDAYYNPETSDPRTMEVIVSKARMGRLGTVNLQWTGALQLVTEPTLSEIRSEQEYAAK